MSSAEWPLVVFTILVQMSAGLLIVSELACWEGDGAANALFARREIVSLALGLVGLLFSFGHLGSPLHSPYAILNLSHSWLSREIFCTGFFLACLAALAIVRRSGASAGLSRWLAALACLAGLATVLVMAKVYMLVTVPAWNSPATVLNFLGTALLLGALASGVLAYARAGATQSAEQQRSLVGVTRLILVIAALGLGLKFVEIPLGLLTGADMNARGVSGLSGALAGGMGFFLSRVVLLIAGAALFVYAALNVVTRSVAGAPAVIGTFAFVLALAGEVLGRFIFFNMHVLIGL